jgi:hypothetical protein
MNLTLLAAASNATLIGHVHIAKTAGTTINGILALNFHNVCGHKGYSLTFNAYQKETKDMRPSGEGKVLGNEMRRRGFEDCDWISNECKWTFWLTLPRPLELHIPCRNISDHLLSVANHQGLEFDCRADGKSEFDRVVAGFHLDRYNYKLVNTDGITAYCFDPDGYVPYMSARLQPKRRFTEYTHQPTNKKRMPACLPPGLIQAALKHPYYKFCSKCRRLFT